MSIRIEAPIGEFIVIVTPHGEFAISVSEEYTYIHTLPASIFLKADGTADVTATKKDDKSP